MLLFHSVWWLLQLLHYCYSIKVLWRLCI